MPVNLNQYRASVEIFNNRFIVCGNVCANLFYRKLYLVTLLLFFLFFFFLLLLFFIGVIHFSIFVMYIESLFPDFFHANCKHIFIYLRLAFYIFMTVLYISCIWLYSSLVKLSGDVGENPGPEPKPCQSFSICH